MSTGDINRDELIRTVAQRQAENDERIRQLVLKHGRLDVLAREVLHYEVQPHHLAMQRHMSIHHHCLILAFRGAGKSTVCTVTGAVFDILQDPNVRICIASKTQTFATELLREIRNHFEANEDLQRIFGDFVGPVWNESNIIVSRRTKSYKEPTIVAVGIGGQIVGKHFDRFYGDDLVDEEQARTEIMREKTQTWFYKAVHPTFEPHCRVRIIGTRYHFEDLYGYMIKHEMKDCHKIIEAVNVDGRSAWPEKYSNEYWAKKKEDVGLIVWDTQYRCRTDSMIGNIFRYEDLDFVDPDDVPADIMGFGGVDLAIKEKEINDMFAMVFIGVTRDRHIYVLSSFCARYRFNKQTEHIVESWRSGADGWFTPGNDPDSRLVKIGIESNAYQHSQVQVLEDTYKGELRLCPLQTVIDKVVRANKLSAHTTAGRIHIVGRQDKLVESLVLFPDGPDDLFDALDIAVTTALYGRSRRAERGKVGVL